MIIQTLERGFSVIRVLENTRDVDLLLCRDLLESDERNYLLLGFKNPDLIYRVMPLFTEQRSNPAFRDFEECFSQDGKFYVVFRHRELPLLADRMEQEVYSLKEKLTIARNLMSQIALLNMPDCIQYEALLSRNLLLDDSLTVSFNYILKEASAYDIIPPSRMQTELAGVLRLMFDQELATKVCQELTRFVEHLEEGIFTDHMEIYREFDQVYVIMMSMEEEGKVEPQSFLFRLWEKIKRGARLLKPILVVGVVAVAFGYLVYTVVNPPVRAVSGPQTTIDQIGTVIIDEGSKL